MSIIIAFLISFLTAILFTPFCIKLGARFNITDKPDARKVHISPIPRTGGIALTVGLIIPLIILSPLNEWNYGLILGGGALILIGILDDKYDINFKIKLVSQLLAAFSVIFISYLRIENIGDFFNFQSVNIGILAIPVTVFYILSVTNSINFADGLDGLIGGLCLLIFSFIALLAYQIENNSILLICACTTGSLLGFLRYNSHPAIIFLGDTGSLLLGFLSAISTILLTQGNTIYSPVLSLFILGFPLIDALFVILERFKEGHSIFKPDKNHFHHKLLKLGMSHQGAVVTIYSIQSLFILLAFIFRFKDSIFLLSLYLLITLSVLIIILLMNNMPIKKNVPDQYMDLYLSVRAKINKTYFYKISLSVFTILIVIFYFSSLFIEKIEANSIIYFSIFIVSICSSWFIQKKILMKLNIFANCFVGSYLIYSIDYIQNNNQLFYSNLISNYFFFILGLLFIFTNFLDLESVYYDPIMYLIFFIALIALGMYQNFISYAAVTLIVVKIILLSMSIDLIINKFKYRTGMITLITIAILFINILKILIQ